jgi:hypothetical protein
LGPLAAPCAAEGQPGGKVYRVGLIFSTSPVSEMVGPEPVHPLANAFVRGLRALSYVERQNLILECRSAEGRFDRFGEIVAELISAETGPGSFATILVFGRRAEFADSPELSRLRGSLKSADDEELISFDRLAPDLKLDAVMTVTGRAATAGLKQSGFRRHWAPQLPSLMIRAESMA